MSQTKAQLIDAVDGSIVTADLADDAVNAAKLASNAVVNASVDASAAIAGTKISPDFGSQNVVTTGNITTSGDITSNGGDITISGASSILHLVDTNDNPNYRVQNIGGTFQIYDATSDVSRLNVNTDGHVDVVGNLDVGAGIDVTGNITCSGTIPAAQLTGTLPAIDGSNLTGIAGITIANNTNNRIITATGNANSINAETNLTFSGTSLIQSGNHVLKNAITDSSGLKISQEASNVSQIFNHYAGPMTFGVNNTEKMRIDSSGNVGIGTTSVDNRLHIESSSNTYLQIEKTGTSSKVYLGNVSGEAVLESTGEAIKLKPNGRSNDFVLTTAGDLGIGTASPAAKLQVAGTLECNNIKFLTANKFESSANVFEGKGTNGARLRSALSAAGTPSFSSSDDNDSGMFLPGSNVLGLSTGGSEALRIDANQHVLIGQSASVTNLQVGTPPLQVSNTGADVAMFRRTSNDAGGPYLTFVKERSGAIVADDDLVGALAFLAHDGTDLDSYSAQIKVNIDGTPGANVTPGALSFHTTGSSSNRTTERMVINSAGNIFIGTTPQGRLARMQISGDNFPTFALGGSQVPLIVSNQDEDYGLQLGTFSSGNGAIQATRNDGTATAYNLQLQPSGGSVIVGNSSTGGDILFANTSGGIVLGSTTNVDSNTLDDYEEGTFTPMSSTEASVYHARYTRIGNLVTINCNLEMKSGQSKDFINLPFEPQDDGAGKNTTNNSTTLNRYAGTCAFFDGGTAVVNLMLFHQGNQGAAAFFLGQTAAGAQQWPKSIDDSEFGQVSVSFTYQAK